MSVANVRTIQRDLGSGAAKRNEETFRKVLNARKRNSNRHRTVQLGRMRYLLEVYVYRSTCRLGIRSYGLKSRFSYPMI